MVTRKPIEIPKGSKFFLKLDKVDPKPSRIDNGEHLEVKGALFMFPPGKKKPSRVAAFETLMLKNQLKTMRGGIGRR